MQSDPRNSAAPGWETEGEAKTQQGHADTLILQPDSEKHQDAPGPSTPQEREERAQRARRRLREADERRRASRALNSFTAEVRERESFGWFAPSEGWTRDLGNEFVRQGFTVEYTARRLGLPAPSNGRAVNA